MKLVTKFKERKLRKRLDVLCALAASRRDGNPSNKFRSYRDYLDRNEQREYALLAYQHFYLCKKLGTSSAYFSPRFDASPYDANSPQAFITVEHDVSSNVEFKRDEDGKIWQYRDGVRTGEWPVSEDALNVVKDNR